MIHLKTTYDQRRKKKDGTLPIVYRITINGQSRDISSGFSCHSHDWDNKKCAVRERNEGLGILSKRVKDMELRLLNKIREYEQEYPAINDVQYVKNYLCNKKDKDYSVKEFWSEEINRLHRANRHSNAIHYETALKRIEKITSLSIQFQAINYPWLSELETRLREKGLNNNSVSVYLRVIRSIYNKAVNLEIADYSHYPFRRYKIKNGPTAPRTLTIDQMKQFFHYTPNSEKMKFAHDIGKLIFMMNGVNFYDLALLTNDNVKNGRMVYQRSKTHKMYSIKMLPEVKNILESYRSNVQNLLLNILTEKEYSNKSRLPKCINQKRKNLNKWLRKVGVALKIKEPLTTYVFRYSFANICRELGYSKDLISQSLGHSYGLRVTDAYLNDYDLRVIDEMNKHVVEEVMKKEG